MIIKLTNAYKDKGFFYAIDVVSLLRVSATNCGHLQEGVLRRILYKEHNNATLLRWWYDLHNTGTPLTHAMAQI